MKRTERLTNNVVRNAGRAMAIVLTAAMLAGCGASASETTAAQSVAQETAQASEAARTEAESADATYTIGIGQFAEHGSLDNCREGFLAGLEEEGFVVGENFTVDYDNANADGSIATQIMQSYVGSDVDLICAIATPMAQSAYAVTRDTDIPVIYTAVTDPAAAELVKEDGSPIGDITGTSDKLPVAEQLEVGKRFFSRKYPDMRYLAYFQAYTNTYAPLDSLKRMYEEALSVENVVGLVIGTRPDCVYPQMLDYLGELSRQTFVIVEYGVESTNDETLKRINRRHTFECSRRAIEETAGRGIITGGHVILGLPGEDRMENLHQAIDISATKLHILKIHQLQIIKGTTLALEYERRPFKLYSPNEYVILLTEYIQHLRPDIVLDRFTSQAPGSMLVAPCWGLKNHEFANLLVNHMRETGAWQGQMYRK